MTSSSILASAVAAALAIAGCGDNFDAPGADTLAVTPTTAALKVGETTQVTVTFQKHGADLVGGRATWTSSDPRHATARGGGTSATITAVAAGTATITASSGELSASIDVTVSPATLARIDITPLAPSLPAGTTLAVKVTATFSDGTTADVTSGVTWVSAKPDIAAIAGTTLTAVVRGDTMITATYMGLFSSTHVFVTDALLVSIEVTPAAPPVALGAPQQFTATGHFTDGKLRNVTATATWVSSMTAIATISNTAGTKGLATALAVGTTTISAAIGVVSGTTTLSVEPAALTAITITPTADLAVSADQQLTATGTFSDRSSLDITPTVTWSSSDPAVATITSAGLASALTVGTTTFTAQRGTISGTAVVNVVLADVGAWVAAAGFTGRPCNDGVKFSMASDLVFVCTATGGVMKGIVALDTSISFAALNPGVTNLMGLAFAVNLQSVDTVMYMSVPSGASSNWFRWNAATTTFNPFALLDSAGNGRFVYAGRFQPTVGNILGTWDPGPTGTPQATVLTGMNPPTGVHAVATATGTVRAIAGSAANNLYVGVLGETPAGAPATGGVFHSTNSAVTWIESDTGIAAADKDLVASVVIDPTDPLTLYTGVRGGGRIYKTTDGGAAWTQSSTGLPARARVSVVYVSPVDHATVFAATDRGLYKATDGGATWTLVGFQGRAVTSIAQSATTASLILTGVDDAVGLYRAQ